VFLRQQIEQFEELFLSPRAALSKNNRGRDRAEEPCNVRTDFQRDRDRIIHSKSFRRLKHKTQVFIAPEGDHYRTRLTHTLEVSQIARTAARALRLNEDLTEAIALGHDLGHTPFGHAGEAALNDLLPGGFRHNEQSGTASRSTPGRRSPLPSKGNWYVSATALPTSTTILMMRCGRISYATSNCQHRKLIIWAVQGPGVSTP
jgi:hypothetical protein